MRTCVYGRYAPVQPIINLQSFKRTPDSLKQRFKAFGRKPSLGAPGPLPISILKSITLRFYMDFSRLQGRSEGGGGSWSARDPHFVSVFFFLRKQRIIFRGENAMTIMFDTA